MGRITSLVKKTGSYVKKPIAYMWRHKKKLLLAGGAAAAGAGALMYTGYLPTPEVIQSAVQVASTTVAEHPEASLAVGSGVASIAGYIGLKKVYKGTKRVRTALKNVPKVAQTLATEAAAKVGIGGKSKGGALASQPTQGQLATINWDKAKFFVPET